MGRSKSGTTWRLGSASSKSGKTSRDLVSRLSSVAPRVDGLLVELQETETRRQETRGQDHVTEGRGQNIESRAHGIGGQGPEIGGQGQETGSRGLRTVDPGQRTGNPDTGPGQGTNLGTEETDQGPERRRRRRKGTDRHPETGIIKNIRRTGR